MIIKLKSNVIFTTILKFLRAKESSQRISGNFHFFIVINRYIALNILSNLVGQK